MKTAIAVGLGSLLALTAFTANSRPAADSRSAFAAEIRGEISARPTGEARFGLVGGADGVPAVLTISLGANSDEGSVLFTRQSAAPMVPGIYTVSDRADGTDDVRALIVTGPVTRPTGVFQGESGELVITSVADGTLRGTFRIGARGFLAAEPEVENRPVEVSGSFTAAN